MKSMWLWPVSILIIVTVMGLFLLQCDKKTQEFKIGILFPLTGDAASYGEKGKRAIDMAIDELNKSGGIHGSKIVAVYEDSQADPRMGVTAIQKLINIDHVPAVVGDIVSSVTLPAAHIAENKKVVLLSPTSSAPAITNAGEYIYRIWPSDLAEGTAIAEFALNRNYKKVTILHLNNDYGLSIASIFKERFESSDTKVVLMEGYLKDESDYRSVLLKVKHEDPDAMYIAGYYADTGKILRQAREIGINIQFLGTTAIEDDKFLELTGNVAEGIIYPLATGFDLSSKSPKTLEFIDAFQKKYNYQPGWVEAQSYDALMLIYTAAKSSSGTIDGSRIKAYFDGMSEYNGVTGIIKFDENGDVVKPVTFKTVRDGKFQTLEN